MTKVVCELNEITFSFVNVTPLTSIHKNLVMWTHALYFGGILCYVYFVLFVEDSLIITGNSNSRTISEFGCLLEFADFMQTGVAYIEPTMASASVNAS